MAEMVGVDVGATAVRVACVAGVDSRGMAIITKIGIVPLPDGAIVGGRIRSPQDVSLTIVRALKEAGAKKYGFVLGIESSDVAISNILLPSSLKVEERSMAIKTMGKAISPTFSIEDSTISTHSRDRVERQGVTMTSVNVAAALSEEVELLKSICSLAGLAPRAIDLSAAGLLRAYTRSNPDNHEIGTVVDIGASRITVATRDGMYLRSVRTISGAGSEVTRAIMQATGEEFKKGEEIKLTTKLVRSSGSMSGQGYRMDESYEGDSITPAERALSNSVDLLVDSIALAIEADAAQHGNISQGIVLTGGTALLRGFKERLTSRVGIPTTIGRPWADIERSRRNALLFKDGNIHPILLMNIGLAAGLALWKDPR